MADRRPRRNRKAVVAARRKECLTIVAGLPKSIHGNAVTLIGGLRPGKVIASPSTERDGGRLYPDQLVSALLKSVTEFADRRRANGPATPDAPADILLLYVPSNDSDELLAAFDFAVLPIPMAALAQWAPRGRQFRHHWGAATAEITGLLAPTGQATIALQGVSQRVRQVRDQEPLLLPPRNFGTPVGPIANIYSELCRGARPWVGHFPEVTPVEFTSVEVPRIQRGMTRRAYQDPRGAVYLTADPAAYHGHSRQLEPESADEERRRVLQQLYRFGVSIPAGFHHDAQLENGEQFKLSRFECSEDGPVEVTATHANVYPDDFVRAKIKTKIKAAN
jgi:hypothetical protein